MRGISLSFVLALALILYGGIASAASVTVNGGQIEVRAQVLPAHTIIVDEQGVIIQIASNTVQDVATPRVFLLNTAAANEQPVTQEVYDEYRRLVLPGESKIGVLYEQKLLTNLLQVPAFSLFPVQRQTLLTVK